MPFPHATALLLMHCRHDMTPNYSFYGDVCIRFVQISAMEMAAARGISVLCARKSQQHFLEKRWC